jgi:hypothetical protein
VDSKISPPPVAKEQAANSPAPEVGQAITDPDAPKARKINTAAGADALAKQAANFNMDDFFAKKDKAPKKPSPSVKESPVVANKASLLTPGEAQVLLAQIRRKIDRKEIPLCGALGGYSYILISDIEKHVRGADARNVIDVAGLPVKVAAGVKMVGIPDVPGD